MCLWVGYLVCVLRGMSSQLSIWRTISEKGLWYYPRFKISDQAVYNRLEKEGVKPLENIYRRMSEILAKRLQPYNQTNLAPFAKKVVAIDCSTLDKVSRHLPTIREEKIGQSILAGKIAAIFDIRLQQWINFEYIEEAEQNERKSAISLLNYIEKGAMILADMGYFGFKWFDQLTDEGYFWLSRLRNKTSYEVIHTYYKNDKIFDGMIWLGAHHQNRAKHAVRLVTIQIGKITYRYITNVCDPTMFSIQEIVDLYARRWDIELAFKLIKCELGLHLIWSAKTVVILQQIWAVFIISQVLQALRVEIAGLAKVDPFDVSLKLMIENIPIWSSDGTDVLSLIVEDGVRTGFICPSRRKRMKVPSYEIGCLSSIPVGIVLTRAPHYMEY
jgi:hypothetical protein